MRLLVVDDDPVFREELAELLSADGHTARAVSSVPHAVEALEQEDYDVVFTDLKMPRHGGLELVRTVRARWPETLVVVVTGFATVETAVEAMKEGAFDYVRKPFRLEAIQRVLALAADQLRARGPAPGRREVRRWIRRWAGGDPNPRPLLWITPFPPADGREAGVTVLPLPAEAPSRLLEEVRSFASAHPAGAVLVEGADRLLAGHRRADIVGILRQASDAMRGHGPFVVTFDPARLTGGAARALAAAVASEETRQTLEALANPMRRAVLERAGRGPTTFGEAMRAAGIDDSPKLAFHLRRLVEDGLLAHDGETYRITPRGEEAMRRIAELDVALPPSPGSNAALPVAEDD
ncbi:MAG: response regulator [Thermoplasmata archaeon]